MLPHTRSSVLAAFLLFAACDGSHAIPLPDANLESVAPSTASGFDAGEALPTYDDASEDDAGESAERDVDGGQQAVRRQTVSQRSRMTTLA